MDAAELLVFDEDGRPKVSEEAQEYYATAGLGRAIGVMLKKDRQGEEDDTIQAEVRFDWGATYTPIRNYRISAASLPVEIKTNTQK